MIISHRKTTLIRVTTGTDGVLCSAERIDPADIEGNAFVDPQCDEGITE